MKASKHSNIWIIGCGDIGRRVARLYPDANINGAVQSTESARLCKDLAIKTHILNLDSDFPSKIKHYQKPDIFYFSPPVTSGLVDTRLPSFLDSLQNNAHRFVLISTTGVYGDSQGEWIDEETPTNPTADRAHRRLSAEKHLQKWARKNNSEYMILRVPGIYAKDRLPLERLRKGFPVVVETEAGWTNRIHADDLAQACKAAMLCKQANEIINVTDGNPSTMTDYFNQIADFAGLPRPTQISMQEAERTLSEGMLSYLKESRRIRHDKMLELLKIKLKYPDLKTALKAEI